SAQALHGRGQERVVAVSAVSHAVFTDIVLVNVNADDPAVIVDSRFDGAGVDAAAAGKDNFGAAGVPALHTGGDVGIAEELVAVPVVDGNVGAKLLRSGVSALHEAVAVTDNGGHSLAAEEAELGEAVLNGGVTGQVTGLLFFEGDAVDVGGDLLGADIAGGDVNADDVDVGVFLSRPGDGGTVQVADADDGDRKSDV